MVDDKLISLINEELNNLLGEAGHDDEEMVNSKNIDLRQEYNALNKQLFGDTLPEIPLKWDNSKTRLGAVRALVNRFTREVKVEYLTMSAYYNINYRQFKNTLAHEMIHVKQMAVMGERGGHGWDFEREARRINGMGLGFRITTKNDEDIPTVNQQPSAKALIAIVYDLDGQYYLSVTTPQVWSADKDSLFNFFQREVNKGRFRNVEITVVESRNPQLLGKRILRGMQRSFSYSPLSDNLLGELLNDNIIDSKKINRGVPARVSEEMSGEWETIEIS
jgi:hypothetical protein